MCCCNQNNGIAEDFVVYGHQFSSGTEYTNSFLKGRYRLNMRGLGPLIKEVEWQQLDSGGFKILIPTFNVTNDTIIIGQFY